MNKIYHHSRYVLSIVVPLLIAGMLQMCDAGQDRETEKVNENKKEQKSDFLRTSFQEDQTMKMKVTATAYNSLPAQTEGHARTTAWGHQLEPGVKSIAVSPDLEKLGLTYKTEVKIEGLPGTYTVLDRLPSRWTKRIDIYMGEDKQRALDWGRKKVNITWNAKN